MSFRNCRATPWERCRRPNCANVMSGRLARNVAPSVQWYFGSALVALISLRQGVIPGRDDVDAVENLFAVEWCKLAGQLANGIRIPECVAPIVPAGVELEYLLQYSQVMRDVERVARFLVTEQIIEIV